MTTLSFRTAFHSAPKRRRHKTAAAVLRNAAGAIDLASIMVGVLVIGIIGGVISATVFAVIPWSQNEAAKATLSSVRTAEAAFSAANSSTFGNLTELQAPLTFSMGSGAPRQPAASVTAMGAPLLPVSDQPLTVIADSSGWAAAATSATGAIYYASSLDTVVSTDMPAVLPDGLDPAALTGGSVGGDPQSYTPASQTVQISRVTSADGSLPVWMISVTSILASDSPYNAASTPPELPFLSNPNLTGTWGTDPLLDMSVTNGTLELADGSSFPLMDHSTLQGDFGADGSHLRRVRMNMAVSGFGASPPSWGSVSEAGNAFVGAKVVFVQNGQMNTIVVAPDAEFGFPSP